MPQASGAPLATGQADSGQHPFPALSPLLWVGFSNRPIACSGHGDWLRDAVAGPIRAKQVQEDQAGQQEPLLC